MSTERLTSTTWCQKEDTYTHVYIDWIGIIVYASLISFKISKGNKISHIYFAKTSHNSEKDIKRVSKGK